jgi:glycosyltransferase involved in cell wall biosynthesis
MKLDKVLIIAKYTFPYDTRLTQQIKTLSRFGIPCDVICGHIQDQKHTEVIDDISIYRVFNMSMDSKATFLEYIYRTIRFIAAVFFKLVRLSLNNYYRIIVVHTLPEFLVLTAFFNKCWGSKIILDGRDLTVDLLSSRWNTKFISVVRFIAVLAEKCIMIFCNEVITASSGFKKSLIQRGISESKITVMMNSADTEIFRFDNNRSFPTIEKGAKFIYHGTVSERFGIFVAVKAMVKIIKLIPGSILHVFGYYDSAYMKEMIDFINKNGISGAVAFNKALPLEEIYENILQMDIGIVPYLSDNFMNKALSTKSFEYIAAGLPIVTSRLNSTFDLFDNSCVHYAEPGNVDDLSSKIIELCQEPLLRKEKRENAYNVFNIKYAGEHQNKVFVSKIAEICGISDLVFC